MNRLIFWQNMPSFHQAALVRSIAQIWSGEVTVVAESSLSVARSKQGWSMPDFGTARLIVSPSSSEREKLIGETSGSSFVHVFSGFHAYPETYRTFSRMVHTLAKVGVFVESGQTGDGIPSILRRFRYGLHALRWGHKIHFLLAAGQLGVHWYRRIGFAPSKIYSFGYFIDSDVSAADVEIGQCPAERPEREIRLLFVGQIIYRKGVDLMLQALASNRRYRWALDIIGDGHCRSTYNLLAQTLGIESRIRWEGVADNRVVQQYMGQADLVILPSRFDGWGVVVNEALIAGARVIVSDTCGSADLITQSFQGRVFRSGSIKSLTQAIAAELSNGKQSLVMREQVRQWARAYINPDCIARYFVDIVAHACYDSGHYPEPPWSEPKCQTLN